MTAGIIQPEAGMTRCERSGGYYRVDRRMRFRSPDRRQVPEKATKQADKRAGEML